MKSVCFIWLKKKKERCVLLDQGTLQTARAGSVCECVLSDIWMPQISNHCISIPSRGYSKEQPLRYDCYSTSFQLLCVMDNEKVILK